MVTLALSALNGINGFILEGVSGGNFTGQAVSGAGDVNDDGLDDVIVGAPEADGGGSSRGLVYVVFGQNSFGATLELSDLDGSNGFTLEGDDFDRAGEAVGRAGDVNGDGIDDVLIGAPAAPGGIDRGQAYVIFGQSSFAATLALSTLNGSNRFTIEGIANVDMAGISVSGGDVNGDGLADLIIGASEQGPNDRGQASVVFGRSSFAATLDLSALDGSNGFTLDGTINFELAGISVSSADVNGDGLADLIIGAYGADRTYVVFGRAHAIVVGPDQTSVPLVQVFNPNGSFRFEILAFDDVLAFGGVRVAAGDVTDDGIPDIVVASGPGIPTRVRVFDGMSGLPTGTDFLAYGPNFTRGAFVAVGDVIALNPGNEIIVGPNRGKQPVRVFDTLGNELTSFFAYGPNFKRGVRVAAGDTDGNLGDEIITGRGAGNGQVRVFDDAGVELLRFRPFRRGATFVTAGDVDGDGQIEIIAARDRGFGSRVRIFDGATGNLENQFTAYTGFKGGVRVGVLPGDGPDTILTGPGRGSAGPEVKLFDGLTLTELDAFFAYDPAFRGGIFVAGG